MRSRGIPRMVFLTLVLFLLLNMPPSLSKPRLAQPGCPESCGTGNVTIPFPFGIGAGCFLDDWYEIDCRNVSTPFLKKIGLEVLDIRLPEYYHRPRADGTIQVSFPVVYNASCAGNRSDPPLSLVGSNFVFSQTRNIFTAVGCNVLAWTTSKTFELFGCQTGCRVANFSRDGICPIGSSCCKTTLPLDLQYFRVHFTGVSSGECPYAFLVDQSWMASHYMGLYPLGTGRQSVPVVLEWGISNQTDVFHLLNNPRLIQFCSSNSLPSDYRTMPFSQCYCPGGYRGNGYLVNGCEDIDECKEEGIVCPGNRKCVNKPGWYDCVDRWKTVKLVLTGIGSGALFLLLCIWRLRKYIKKRKAINLRKKYFKRQLKQQLNTPDESFERSRIFTSKNLKVATDNFNQSRVLGRGGQGTVYKGMLTDGRIVAIKKPMVVDEEKLEQFINEVVILSQINHRNIVKLLGCCLETHVPLLVYVFIPNGTLYQYLHDPEKELPLTWKMRLRIGAEISGALSYLHSAASIPIYHRDIKSTNILLDEKYQAKVADFGASKSISLEQTHVTTIVQGTFGYLDPEYFQTSQFTNKSDVYSFGVVLVELLTGEKAISSARAEDGRSLAAYFKISLEENRLLDILHPQVKEEATEEEITRVARLAKRCLHSHGKNRPTMWEVAAELEEIRNVKFSSGILRGHGNDGNIEEHVDCLAPDEPNPDAAALASSDELPLLVTTSE